jgi:hypothetical protein
MSTTTFTLAVLLLVLASNPAALDYLVTQVRLHLHI